MVFGLRNMGLVLVACGGWLLCLRVSCVISLFLTLFASVMTESPAVKVLLVVYALTGGLWLLLTHWHGLQRAFVLPSQQLTTQMLGPRERLPLWRLGLLAVLALGSVALIGFGPRQLQARLGELLPTSGGTGAADRFARAGFGDGPEEMAGNNPLAAGMVESQKMIEDNERSLIDAVSDMYGPPHKPKQEQERMVAASRVDVVEMHKKPPENRRPSREFSTSREGPKEKRRVSSHGARGVL